MGYVFDFKDAVAYEKWFEKRQNRFAFDMETRLMLKMLNPMRGASVIDIGCGIGANLLPLLESGIEVTGVDPSPYMIDIAQKKVGNRVDFHRCFAEDLPFEDNSFNYACLITTLEFSEDPVKAIEEACRVAKDKLFIGILNKHAIKGIQIRVRGMFTETVYKHANLFSIWEIKQIIRDTVGKVPVSWKTVYHLPSVSGKLISSIEEHSGLARVSPFGSFAGIAVTLVPKYKTKSIPVFYRPERAIGATES